MFTIITACSRIDLINKVGESIPNITYLKWIICYDLSKIGEFKPTKRAATVCGGHSENNIPNTLKNSALSLVDNRHEWVYCLDDDNIMHPNLINIEPYLRDLRYDIITFDQQMNDGSIRKGDNPKLDFIDQAQFMIRKKIHDPYPDCFGHDGQLIERLVNENKKSWLYVPRVMCYYNKLRP